MPVYHGRAEETETFLRSKRSLIPRFEVPSHSHNLPDNLSENREVEEFQLEDVELRMYDDTDLSGAQFTATFPQNKDEVDSTTSIRSLCDTQTLPDVCQTNGPSRSSETCFGLVGYGPFMMLLLAKVSVTDMWG